jgi:hypothetical protein
MSSSTSSGVRGAPDRARARRLARLAVGAIALICAVPIVAALIAYFLFPPAGRVNYGELLPPKPLPAVVLMRRDDQPFALSELKGKWVMLHADRADCRAACEAKLFNMRQTRLAQGREMERIERVWLLLDNDEPAPASARLYEGVVLVRDPDRTFTHFLPAAEVRDHIYLIDPLGNLMLRFPKDADPKRMINDLARLLKVSRIG